MPKFQTDDQVRVRESSGVWNRRGQVATVISSYGAGEVDVKFTNSQLRYTFSEDELEPVLRNSTKGEEVVVSSRESQWFGRRGTIKYRYPTGGMVDVDFGIGNVGTLHERYLRFTTPATETKQPQAVRLVGITGRKRAGKDTVAARLVDKHGFKRMAFADNVRKVALAIDPLIETEVGLRRLSAAVGWLDWEKAKEIPEVRRLLQRIGTEAIRSLESDFWIRQVMRQAVVSSAPVVITDVRFPNEADAIKKAGGVILRVNRPGQSQDDQHSSESAMDGYLHDWSLNNSGTVEELFVKVDELVANGFKPA